MDRFNNLAQKIILIAAAVMTLATTLLLMGCASTDGDRNPASFGGSNPSKAHPASYITDVFRVNRPLPAHKPSVNTEFYFKSCKMVGENWPQSRTSYDCEYP